MAESQKARTTEGKHLLEVSERKNMTVSGVTDVVSFDDACIVLSTSCGIMSIDGSDMHIISLDLEKGNVQIEGSFNGIIYPENAPKSGFFRKRQK